MAKSSTDPYAALGVSRSATQDDVRRAYRKLAREFHPDVRPGDKVAEERFKQVTAAHEILGDARKRALFDEFGEGGLREGFDAAQARAYQGFGGGGAGQGGAGPDAGMGFDLGDMLGDLFGGGGPSRRQAPERVATVEVNFVEAVRGTELQLSVPQPVRCAACHGSGAAPGSAPERCGACRGSGQLEMGGLRTRCPHCRGKGQQRAGCRSCGGQGTQEQSTPVAVRVPPGAAHGDRLRVPAAGGSRGSGGLTLEIRVRPHPWFRREKLDWVVRLPLTVAEAILGATVPVPTPSGPVKLRVPPGAQPGTRLRLRGRGVQRGSKAGDLFAELELVVPEATTPEAQAAARALDAAYPAPVRDKLHF